MIVLQPMIIDVMKKTSRERFSHIFSISMDKDFLFGTDRYQFKKNFFP